MSQAGARIQVYPTEPQRCIPGCIQVYPSVSRSCLFNALAPPPSKSLHIYVWLFSTTSQSGRRQSGASASPAATAESAGCQRLSSLAHFPQCAI
eukprot:5006386-Pyramimonas_sp.AAC.1